MGEDKYVKQFLKKFQGGTPKALVLKLAHNFQINVLRGINFGSSYFTLLSSYDGIYVSWYNRSSRRIFLC